MKTNAVIIVHDASEACFNNIKQIPGVDVTINYQGTIFINAELTASDETTLKGLISEIEAREDVDQVNVNP